MHRNVGLVRELWIDIWVLNLKEEWLFLLISPENRKKIMIFGWSDFFFILEFHKNVWIRCCGMLKNSFQVTIDSSLSTAVCLLAAELHNFPVFHSYYFKYLCVEIDCRDWKCKPLIVAHADLIECNWNELYVGKQLGSFKRLIVNLCINCW